MADHRHDEHGDDDGSGGLPAELQDREKRVAKLRSVREQLEAERGKELRESSQKSFADPDANMMMTGEGSLQYCYNAQAATSAETRTKHASRVIARIYSRVGAQATARIHGHRPVRPTRPAHARTRRIFG